MPALTREELRALAKAPKVEKVPTPEAGPDAYCVVRVMTGTDRDSLEVSMMRVKGDDTHIHMRNFRAKLAVRCLVDDAGAYLYGTANEDGTRSYPAADIIECGATLGNSLDRIYDVAARINAVTDADEKKILGNSDAAQKGNAGSGLQPNSDTPASPA